MRDSGSASSLLSRISEDRFVRVFVSEYLVGGGVDASTSSTSMEREGLAMLTAVMSDIALIPDCQVVTTLRQDLRATLEGTVIRVEGPNEESTLFEQLTRTADAVLVIAPETDGVLAARCRRVIDTGGVSWNCAPDAIELCGDKLRLAAHLQSHGVPTIPTALENWAQDFDPNSPAVVVKPRDGAGSTLTFLVKNLLDWRFAAERYRQSGMTDRALRQPFVRGRSLSVGMNFGFDGQLRGCLPVGEQRLSDDGRFRYLGGVIPAQITPEQRAEIEQVVLAVCRTISGLAGYIGIDLLLTDGGEVLIVEINPRLTTSYVGYRQLMSGLLPSLWMSTDVQAPFVGGTDPIEFSLP